MVIRERAGNPRAFYNTTDDPPCVSTTDYCELVILMVFNRREFVDLRPAHEYANPYGTFCQGCFGGVFSAAMAISKLRRTAFSIASGSPLGFHALPWPRKPACDVTANPVQAVKIRPPLTVLGSRFARQHHYWFASFIFRCEPSTSTRTEASFTGSSLQSGHDHIGARTVRIHL